MEETVTIKPAIRLNPTDLEGLRRLIAFKIHVSNTKMGGFE